MANLKTNAVNAYETTLSSALAAGATTINVTDTTGSPAVPFYVVLDPGNDAKREVVLVDGAKTATTFTLSAATSRGQDGTSDVAHDSGAVVAIVPVAAMWNDLHDRADANNTLITSGDAPGHTHNAAYRALAYKGAFAYRSAAQSLPNATFTAISFDTEQYDTDAIHDNVTNPSRLTVPAGLGGKWLVQGIVQFGANNTARRILRINRTSTTVAEVRVPPVSSGTTNVPIAVTINAAAADYFELVAFQDSGGALNAEPGVLTHLIATYMGA